MYTDVYMFLIDDSYFVLEMHTKHWTVMKDIDMYW